MKASRNTRAVLLLLVGVLAFPAAYAQTQAVNTFGPPIHTVFWTQSALSLYASCSGFGCIASTSLFCKTASIVSSTCIDPDPSQEGVTCPLPAGGKCVFHIGLETSTTLTNTTVSNVDGLYRFLVDGLPPILGPAPNSNGYTEWAYCPDCTGPQSVYVSNYVSVVAIVTNKTLNQFHSIEIDDACQGFSGCQVYSFRALARIDTFLAAPDCLAGICAK